MIYNFFESQNPNIGFFSSDMFRDNFYNDNRYAAKEAGPEALLYGEFPFRPFSSAPVQWLQAFMRSISLILN
jgi:hypothetical protein